MKPLDRTVKRNDATLCTKDKVIPHWIGRYSDNASVSAVEDKVHVVVDVYVCRLGYTPDRNVEGDEKVDFRKHAQPTGPALIAVDELLEVLVSNIRCNRKTAGHHPIDPIRKGEFHASLHAGRTRSPRTISHAALHAHNFTHFVATMIHCVVGVRVAARLLRTLPLQLLLSLLLKDAQLRLGIFTSRLVRVHHIHGGPIDLLASPRWVLLAFFVRCCVSIDVLLCGMHTICGEQEKCGACAKQQHKEASAQAEGVAQRTGTMPVWSCVESRVGTRSCGGHC
mmetsp:Transcript_41053/g.103443  ORF Transcript_41053/g.103443 Transcript_41053/m.103443 type:complete len:281 (+) Transcript_41053:222-1064(+)